MDTRALENPEPYEARVKIRRTTVQDGFANDDLSSKEKVNMDSKYSRRRSDA